MITVDEALAHVLQRSTTLPSRTVELRDALGRVLAHDVVSDVDSPPHDKSIVDGYAVIAADLAGGVAELDVLEEVVAGAVPTRTVTAGTATRIMTGAPLPAGADAVVMVERTELLAGDRPRVRIADAPLRSGQNITRRGAAMRAGQVVLRAGQPLRPIEIGLLAEVGQARVDVVPRPRVAVLSTGNELVPIDAQPGPAQIRNSNEPLLIAAAERAGAEVTGLGIARDDRDDLRRLIGQGLDADVLILSGGVSAGVLDLVPEVLVELGVQPVFHKVRVKPGKPVWFGVLAGKTANTLVFGLPGNPVSSYVCFELFVRPALGVLAGHADWGLVRVSGLLAREHRQRGDRPSYHPALYRSGEQGNTIEPLTWAGSGDLRGLSAANALAYFPAGDRVFQPGEPIDALLLDERIGRAEPPKKI
jgi:molybdopterin molybdotransferase